MPPVKTKFFLVIKARVDERGNLRGKPSVRTTANRPKTASDEVAMEMEVAVPASLFRAPQLQARVTIPEEKAPRVLAAEVANNIAEVIREQSGLNIRLIADENSGIMIG